MGELTIYEDRMVENFLPQIIASATKRNYTIHWALQSRRSQTTGKPYFKRTIVAVQDEKPFAAVRLNRRGSVYWDLIGSYYQLSYEIKEQL